MKNECEHAPAQASWGVLRNTYQLWLHLGASRMDLLQHQKHPWHQLLVLNQTHLATAGGHAVEAAPELKGKKILIPVVVLSSDF